MKVCKRVHVKPATTPHHHSYLLNGECCAIHQAMLARKAHVPYLRQVLVSTPRL